MLFCTKTMLPMLIIIMMTLPALTVTKSHKRANEDSLLLVHDGMRMVVDRERLKTQDLTSRDHQNCGNWHSGMVSRCQFSRFQCPRWQSRGGAGVTANFYTPDWSYLLGKNWLAQTYSQGIYRLAKSYPAQPVITLLSCWNSCRPSLIVSCNRLRIRICGHRLFLEWTLIWNQVQSPGCKRQSCSAYAKRRNWTETRGLPRQNRHWLPKQFLNGQKRCLGHGCGDYLHCESPGLRHQCVL